MDTANRTIRLAKDIEMPSIGFGTYLIADDDVPAVVGEAIDVGYRHVDTAEGYDNETGVGAAIRECLKAGRLSRGEIFVTTKLWPGNPAWGNTPKSKEATISALDTSLAKLGTDQVDLYLIHGPFAQDQRLAQWEGLLELREQGKARAIGVSNYNERHIEEIKAAGLPLPDANQIELHPWSQKPELVSYLFDHGIKVIAYSSLVPLSTWRTAEGQASAKTEQMRADSQSPESPFHAMAEKYGVTEAQVLLRWGLQKGFAVLPKSVNRQRMQQNMDLFSFSIDDNDMASIGAMDRGDGVAWSMGDPSKVT